MHFFDSLESIVSDLGLLIAYQLKWNQLMNMLQRMLEFSDLRYGLSFIDKILFILIFVVIFYSSAFFFFWFS